MKIVMINEILLANCTKKELEKFYSIFSGFQIIRR